MPSDLRDVSFPLAVRGYDRSAVDAYVKRVNHLIAELEVSRSPRAAVRHALDRAAEEVSSILQRAQEAAEEITSSARKEAEESKARAGTEATTLLVDANDDAERTRAEAEVARAQARTEAEETLTKARAEAEETLTKARAEAKETLTKARAEAKEILTRSRAEASERLQRSEKELAVLRELAEAQMRDLQADTEAVWEERHELLGEIRGMAAQLEEVAHDAAARFPPPEPGGRSEEDTAAPVPAGPEPNGLAAADSPTIAMPATGSGESADDEAPENAPGVDEHA